MTSNTGRHDHLAAVPTFPDHCPICRAVSARVVETTNTMGVTTAVHICANEHLWEQRWTAPTWPAA